MASASPNGDQGALERTKDFADAERLGLEFAETSAC